MLTWSGCAYCTEGITPTCSWTRTASPSRLPVNVVASAIYRANWQAEYPATNPDELPAIHGTAVLFLRRVWF